jgi:hypothetical protein
LNNTAEQVEERTTQFEEPLWKNVFFEVLFGMARKLESRNIIDKRLHHH